MANPTQARELFAKALRAYQEQRPDAAAKHCQKALKADADFFEAMHLRGMLALNDGDWQTAATYLRRASELQPQRAELHAQLGFALQSLGRLDEARTAVERALTLTPRQPQLLCQLGRIFVDQNRFDEACDTFSEARRLAPNDPGVHYFLGQAEYCRGRHEAAIENLNIARRLNPAHAFTGVVLGRAYTALGRYDEAIASYRQAIATDAKCEGAYLNLGNLLDEQGQRDEALAVLEEGARLNPGAAILHCALAEEYERASRVSDAEAAVDDALKAAPGDPHTSLIAARLDRRAGRLDAARARLEKLKKVALPVERGIELYFELGQIADRAGDTARALDYFAEANRRQFDRWEGAEERRQSWLAEVDSLQARFTADWVSGWRPLPAPDVEPTPIFLVGFPRSGTTLLDLMLEGHPRLAVMEEAPTTVRLKEAAEQLVGGYPDGLADVDEGDVERLRRVYFAEAGKHAHAGAGTMLLDKVPLALVDAGLIHRVFPRARFILALRHPCDVVLSCFMQRFETNMVGVSSSRFEHIATLYERVMDLWQTYVQVLPLQYHRVRYEDLLADAEGEMRKLCAFLELEWNDDMLDNVSLARRRGKINTPSYSQVSEPIYTRARYRWERYREPLATVEARLRRFIEQFGYQV